MQAMIRSVPLARTAQVSMSILNTPFRRYAYVIEARGSAGVWSCEASEGFAWLPLPRLAGLTSARCWLLGANTP